MGGEGGRRRAWGGLLGCRPWGTDFLLEFCFLKATSWQVSGWGEGRTHQPGSVPLVPSAAHSRPACGWPPFAWGCAGAVGAPETAVQRELARAKDAHLRAADSKGRDHKWEAAAVTQVRGAGCDPGGGGQGVRPRSDRAVAQLSSLQAGRPAAWGGTAELRQGPGVGVQDVCRGGRCGGAHCPILPTLPTHPSPLCRVPCGPHPCSWPGCGSSSWTWSCRHGERASWDCRVRGRRGEPVMQQAQRRGRLQLRRRSCSSRGLLSGGERGSGYAGSSSSREGVLGRSGPRARGQSREACVAAAAHERSHAADGARLASLPGARSWGALGSDPEPLPERPFPAPAQPPPLIALLLQWRTPSGSACGWASRSRRRRSPGSSRCGSRVQACPRV